jgi:hypothetical protein
MRYTTPLYEVVQWSHRTPFQGDGVSGRSAKRRRTDVRGRRDRGGTRLMPHTKLVSFFGFRLACIGRADLSVRSGHSGIGFYL